MLDVSQQDAAIMRVEWQLQTSVFVNIGSTSDAVATIEGLRQEINKLTQEHLDALKSGTDLGMMPDEAEACEARRKTIRELAEELWCLRVRIENFNV